MKFEAPHVDTLLLQDGGRPAPGPGATVAPIEQSTAYAYADAEMLESVFAGREPGYVYARLANPTVARLEQRMATLEDGRGAVACASGMAAVALVMQTLAGAGDEIVSGNSVFGGTYSFFQNTLSRNGITTRFVEATDVEAYRAALNDRTRAVFVETLGNPKLDVPDLAAIAAVAREQGVALVVDNTVPTPLLLRPKTLGADIAIYSASKYLNGHGNAIGGLIVDTGVCDWTSPRYTALTAWRERVGAMALLTCLRAQMRRDYGSILAPLHAFLIGMGMDTLGLRMERHCASARRVADCLAHHPRVRETRYPGRTDHPDHAVACRQFGGRYGGLVTLRLESKAQCFRFLNGLKLARTVVNIGDTRTLAIHPASTFCRDLSPAQQQAVGVSDGLVRLSIGLEHADDIVDDLEQSLAKL